MKEAISEEIFSRISQARGYIESEGSQGMKSEK